MSGSNKYYTQLEGYMIHDSIGNEVFIYQSVEDGYFYIDDDQDFGWMYPPKMNLLLKFNLSEEFHEAVLAHILKFG